MQYFDFNLWRHQCLPYDYYCKI